MRAALVGATGAVGTEMLNILAERDFPADELVPVASPRSAGRKLDYKGTQVEVRALAPDVFDGVDVALFDVPDDVALEWAPVAVERGAVVVDNSAAFRMDPDVPLVVPEVNPHALDDVRKGVIASANCTTLAIVVPLAALHARAGLERLVLASYQAASGSGKPGVDELWDQTQRAAKESDAVTAGLAREVLDGGETFVHPIALNVVPKCGSLKNDGYTSEELKLCNETRKIVGLPDLRVTATCVRVPVVVGHSVAVHAEFARPITADEARAVLEDAAGVEVRDDPSANVYPTPLEAAGRDPCYVGRIRQDLFDDRALELFCVADNLRKGAALNTVQIAELLLSRAG
ncbi:MAG TPA: aspartate-semialdehyde dehydrogenase [Actinomycetota bacterium]|nr:aspartate-semialdehyde dehydrogenase [Actinomycetota bacterium]